MPWCCWLPGPPRPVVHSPAPPLSVPAPRLLLLPARLRAPRQRQSRDRGSPARLFPSSAHCSPPQPGDKGAATAPGAQRPHPGDAAPGRGCAGRGRPRPAPEPPRCSPGGEKGPRGPGSGSAPTPGPGGPALSPAQPRRRREGGPGGDAGPGWAPPAAPRVVLSPAGAKVRGDEGRGDTGGG